VRAVLDTKTITRLRFWEGFVVPGVNQGGGSRELGSPVKRVLPPLSRWQLLVWLMLPLIPILRATEACQDFDTSNAGSNATAF